MLTRPLPDSNSILVIAGPSCRCDAEPLIQHGLIRGKQKLQNNISNSTYVLARLFLHLFFILKVENEMEKCQIPQRHRQSPSKCYASDTRVHYTIIKFYRHILKKIFF